MTVDRERWFFWPSALEPISDAAFDEQFYRYHQGEYSLIALDAKTFCHASGQQLAARLQRAGAKLVIRVEQEELPSILDFCGDRETGVAFEVLFTNWDQQLEHHLEALATRGSLCQLTWRVSRLNGILAVIERLPEPYWPKLRFFFSYKQTADDEYYSIAEVARVLEDLQLRYPALEIRPPEHYEIPNPNQLHADATDPVVAPRMRARPNQQRPRISYVIPTFNNSLRLCTVLRNLMDQLGERGLFEVIVVDDGSVDDTEAQIRLLQNQCTMSFNFTYLYFPRQRSRRMGDAEFRAGRARNLGVKWAEGDILCFLDSDILVPPSFSQTLMVKHQEFDIIQPCRAQVRRAYSRGNHRAKDLVNEIHLEKRPAGYWEQFQEQTLDWNELPWRWRYVSTFCLSIKTNHFKALGWFKQTFCGYGFEDTDLGFRAYRAGLRFLLCREQVYHLKHPLLRSEYFHSPLLKDLLLSRSIKTFYLNNLDREIFLALQIYFDREMLKTKWKDKFFGKLRSATAQRWNQYLLGHEAP